MLQLQNSLWHCNFDLSVTHISPGKYLTQLNSLSSCDSGGRSAVTCAPQSASVVFEDAR